MHNKATITLTLKIILKKQIYASAPIRGKTLTKSNFAGLYAHVNSKFKSHFCMTLQRQRFSKQCPTEFHVELVSQFYIFYQFLFLIATRASVAGCVYTERRRRRSAMFKEGMSVRSLIKKVTFFFIH